MKIIDAFKRAKTETCNTLFFAGLTAGAAAVTLFLAAKGGPFVLPFGATFLGAFFTVDHGLELADKMKLTRKSVKTPLPVSRNQKLSADL